MKVKIRKHCKIHGKPAAPGEIHDVHEARAKALTDNKYAEPVEETVQAPVSPANPNPNPIAPAADPNTQPLTAPVEAAKSTDPEPAAE